MDILILDDLKKLINKSDTGILFCFGNSFTSKMIQAKTRVNDKEIVPSHVALIINGTFLYESTSREVTLGSKTIPAGVRRYLLKDFFRLEKDKGTKYVFYPHDIDMRELEKHIHKPYGKDLIVDFLFKDGSDGVSRGLICSQYGNLVTKLIPDNPCPSPADMFRAMKRNEELDIDDIL